MSFRKINKCSNERLDLSDPTVTHARTHVYTDRRTKSTAEVASCLKIPPKKKRYLEKHSNYCLPIDRQYFFPPNRPPPPPLKRYFIATTTVRQML